MDRLLVGISDGGGNDFNRCEYCLWVGRDFNPAVSLMVGIMWAGLCGNRMGIAIAQYLIRGRISFFGDRHFTRIQWMGISGYRCDDDRYLSAVL